MTGRSHSERQRGIQYGYFTALRSVLHDRVRAFRSREAHAAQEKAACCLFENVMTAVSIDMESQC
jgi:hypothetical protein